MPTYVIALGGNAISNGASLSNAANAIARLHLKGNDIIVTYGNGPQVGELAVEENRTLAVLTAQTQAWIGMIIEDKITSALRRLPGGGKAKQPAIIITRVAVDKRDMAFSNPTKPIGRFYAKASAPSAKGAKIAMKLMHGGYRRVVPSPEPAEILQMELIESALGEGRIAIACGGGGIPVVRHGSGYRLVDAVIDKDKASSLLASKIGADHFFILTNVDMAYTGFGTAEKKPIYRISAADAAKLLRAGEFEEGSMAPKIESCIRFAKASGKSAGIGSIMRPDRVFSMQRLTLIDP